MESNPLKNGRLTENSAGIGTVTRKMVRERAVELAEMDGRPAASASKSDWEQAKRELIGPAGWETKEQLLESVPESENWDPVPGTTGGKVLAAPGEDEDEEGRSDNQRLVEEGLADAEHEQSLASARADEQAEK